MDSKVVYEYTVIECPDSKNLAGEVSIHLNKGWHLSGGVVVSVFVHDRPPNRQVAETTYAQAMWRVAQITCS